MAIPVPGPDARGLVSFRLLGIPVSIHASFLVVVFLLGATGQGFDAALVWLVVVTVSVVAHELGHALVARPAGGAPRIDLFGIAGLTRWNPSRASRGRRVAVSLAGVGAGLAFGLALLALYYAVDPGDGTLLEYAFDAALFANLGWGLLNLLPMLPLDGGQVVHALMRGDDLTRTKRTAYVSVAVAALVAGAAIAADMVVAGLFVLFFGASNVQTLLAIRRAVRGPQPDVARVNALFNQGRYAEAMDALGGFDDNSAVLIRATCLLRLGDPKGAMDAVLDAGVRVDPTFDVTLLLANGQDRLARERLASLSEGGPDWAVRELVVLLRARGENLDEWLGHLTGTALNGVVTALFTEKDYAAAARWGDRALTTGADHPVVAYNTACAWARAGDVDRGLRALDHAVLLGFRDLALLDGDEDLAALREHPGWAAVRSRLG